jgi:hypothetical protein
MFYIIGGVALVVGALVIRLSFKRAELHERLLQNFNKPFDN